MANTVIIPGPSRYPECGGMTAAPGKGINVLDLALYPGAKAKSVDIRATGDITIFLNGEERKFHQIGRDFKEFSHRGEGQDITGKRYGTIRLLEIVGSGQFSLTVTQ